MSLKSKSTEDILTIINHVSFKKTEGKLYLMTERLAWMTNTSDSFKISEFYVNIKNQRISADAKDKVQLQLIMHSSSSLTFQFTNPDGRKMQITDRDEMKTKLSTLLPRFRDKAQKELEEKKKICEKNPLVLSLYRELVGNRYLCKEEFWCRIEQTIDRFTQNDYSNLQKGVPAILLVNLGQNNRQVQCGDTMIKDIFKVYPSVKECFHEKGNTVKDFWNKFFQSHYYHLFKMYQSNDIFRQCEEKDIIIIKKEAENLKFLRFYDNAMDKSGEFIEKISNATSETDEYERKYTTSQQLMRRITRQSALIMKTMRSNSVKRLHSNESVDLDFEIKKPKLTTSKILLNDEEMPVFTGQNVREEFITYKPDRIKNFIAKMAINKLTSKPMNKNVRQRKIGEMKPVGNLMLSSVATDVLTEIGHLFSNTDLLRTNNGIINRNKDNSVKEMINDLKRLYQTSSELFRHFWECFPIYNTERFEKLHRMMESVKKFKTDKIEGFINDHGNHYLITGSMENKAVDHLIQMTGKINQAYERYLKNYNKYG